MKETPTHVYFWGSIFSQWYKSDFSEGSIKFTSAEQYMMYRKALLFGDIASSEKILATNNPKAIKAIGRLIKAFNEDVWDNHKYQIVVRGNLLKFSQNMKLKEALLKTGDKILVEGSPYDRIWGVGLKWDDPEILNESNWRGFNLLGKALMEVRDLLNQKA